jgi:hypothetical protein
MTYSAFFQSLKGFLASTLVREDIVWTPFITISPINISAFRLGELMAQIFAWLMHCKSKECYSTEYKIAQLDSG